MKKDILKEDNATYTYENAIYSKKVTDKEGMEVKKSDSLLYAVSCKKSVIVLSTLISGN